MKRFAFDGFVLDLTAGDLRRGDTPLEPRPQIYALLAHLVVNRGRLVSKEELIDTVWNGAHVTDSSVNRAVAELRDLLDDDPREPRRIQTVPRRGYRFIGDVREVDNAFAAEMSSFSVIHEGRAIPLVVGVNLVGRVPDCQVQVIGTSVSREHARITVSPAGAVIEDLGSTNGTFVGDRRVSEPTPLRDGDAIRIGKERLRIVSSAHAHAPTEPEREL